MHPRLVCRNRLQGAEIISSAHTLFVTEYDHKTLRGFIERAVHREEAATWNDLACRLSWLGDWEFSDYLANEVRR